jgi:hypothetical protein
MTIRVPLTPKPPEIACIALALVTVAMIAFAPSDQHGVALLGDESAASEIVDERLVDRRRVEGGEVANETDLSAFAP